MPARSMASGDRITSTASSPEAGDAFDLGAAAGAALDEATASTARFVARRSPHRAPPAAASATRPPTAATRPSVRLVIALVPRWRAQPRRRRPRPGVERPCNHSLLRYNDVA